MTRGRLFQARGPATANALSPSDVIVRGMSSIMLAADREPGRPQPARRTSSARYPGARPFKHLRTSVANGVSVLKKGKLEGETG